MTSIFLLMMGVDYTVLGYVDLRTPFQPHNHADKANRAPSHH